MCVQLCCLLGWVCILFGSWLCVCLIGYHIVWVFLFSHMLCSLPLSVSGLDFACWYWYVVAQFVCITSVSHLVLYMDVCGCGSWACVTHCTHLQLCTLQSTRIPHTCMKHIISWRRILVVDMPINQLFLLFMHTKSIHISIELTRVYGCIYWPLFITVWSKEDLNHESCPLASWLCLTRTNSAGVDQRWDPKHPHL